MTLLEDLNVPAEKLLNPAFRLLLNMRYQELSRYMLKKYRTMFGADPIDKNLIHELVIEFINKKWL